LSGVSLALNTEGEQVDETTKQEKPRGACTGCRFEYQLGTARTGEYKGELVIRKHNSRTGPGLCEGAAKPPREPETDGIDPGCCDDAGTPDNPDIPFAVAVAPGGIPVFSDPAPVHTQPDPQNGERGPWFRAGYDAECDGMCGGSILEGDQIRADGTGGWLCEDCGADEPLRVETRTTPLAGTLTFAGHEVAGVFTNEGRVDLSPPPVSIAPTPEQCAAQGAYVLANGGPTVTVVGPGASDQFAAPAPVAAEMPSVSQQPDPDRDRWGRYMIMGKPHTRATTFAKAASSTFSLNQWQQRMTIAGLVIRPDLIALAHGLDVKRDRATLNSIAEQAKEAAGQKVAANLGTAYHAFSERLDAGLIALSDVPTEYRHRLDQYLTAVNGAGLRTRPEWIERTVAVRADQVSAELPVAGTLDRIFQLPNGELVIGDLKTGADLSYGWGEIAVQLALYAHGVNTHGLFDWNTKTWENRISSEQPTGVLRIRTDFAIVVHLPAGGEGCTLYRVDLNAGWKRAQVCGQVMAMQKAKPETLAVPFTSPEPVPRSAQPFPAPQYPAPQPLASYAVQKAAQATPQDYVLAPTVAPQEQQQASDAWAFAVDAFRNATSQEHMAKLYETAVGLGFHTDQLATLVGIGKDRLNKLA
jgi:hypothetical protein